MEFQINQKELTFNNEDMKKNLELVLAEYRGAVFTDDSIPMAKKVVADLRKQQKAFKDRIIEVKKEHMKPFDKFKEKADEIIQMFDEPIGEIDLQVKEFVEMQKKEKKIQIEVIYDGLVPEELFSYMPLGDIYDTKWENKTTRDITLAILEMNEREKWNCRLNNKKKLKKHKKKQEQR